MSARRLSRLEMEFWGVTDLVISGDLVVSELRLN
ncbi:hypothetical protein SLEP1_g59287 [Rubroshorea leprosula]|uniref:Uncharacterized protein n=1 Tax=Rubroshorea leprosula TaxID=152421 RepID=A0AAV5MRW5_9ROSI|nr:hypothetical protein SLEP1_g59287 [Rubroshorea leprosula]